MAEAIVSGHFGGAGLDAETLTMMLDAVGAFVAHALPPQRQLQLDFRGCGIRPPGRFPTLSRRCAT